jgi:tetratricopeptide (TPR) repeat protein
MTPARFFIFIAIAVGLFPTFAHANSPIGPSQRLLDKLAVAKSEAEADFIYQDILSAWLDSGGPTVDILLERGVDAHASGDLKLARDMYDRVILIEPDVAEVWYRRGAIFYAEGKLDEAILDFEECVRLEPRHFDAWLALAAIFESVDQNEAAYSAYSKVLKIYPHSRYAKQAAKRLEPTVKGRSM